MKTLKNNNAGIQLLDNDKGFVFVVSMMLLGVLVILATTAYQMTRAEQYTSRNFHISKMALYDAEAGIQYVREKIEADLKGTGPGAFSLPENIGDSKPFPYSTPDEYYFEISEIKKTARNKYEFKSTGYSHENNSAPFSTGKAEITATMKRSGGMNYAVFGNKNVNILSQMDIYSYNYNPSDPSTWPSPAPYDADTYDNSLSTGKADIASNGAISVKKDSYIDGDIHIYYVSADKDPDVFSVSPSSGSVQIQGDKDLEHDRIDPDPFNISGITGFSSEPDAIMVTSTFNASNEFLLNSTQSYFNTDLNVENGQKILIDTGAAGDNLNIYFEGNVEFKAGATLEITGEGNLTIHHTKGNFIVKNGVAIIQPPSAAFDSTRLILLSSSSGKIDLMHSGSFTGLIYAPDATLNFDKSTGIYGAVWANIIDVQNSTVIFYDTYLAEKYPGNEIVFTSWFNHRVE